MTKTLEQLKQELDAKIPRDVIKTRDGGNGVQLDYLSSYYVIKRLNEVLGQGNWSYTINALQLVHAGPFEKTNWRTKEKEQHFSAHYLAKILLAVRLSDGTAVTFEDVGYGDGTDKAMLGKCHELASKEAVTDGIKRCAKNLGMSFGLALYDKEQENVSEETETTTGPTGKMAQSAKEASNDKAPTVTEENAKKLIKQSFEVLNAQKKTNKEKFVEQYLKPHGVAKTDALTSTQVNAVMSQLRTAHPELGL